ncbi:response regulator transcription factor [Nostoc sp. NIES-2111]
MQRPMIQVGIVEDNAQLRKSLEALFSAEADLACVWALGSLVHLQSEIEKAKPDIILMDIGLPHIPGTEGVRLVKATHPEIEVLMFTVFEEEEHIFEAIRNGASGYLLKQTPPAEILEAVRELSRGGAPMTPSIARRVLTNFRQPGARILPDYDLTPRERDILQALVDGLSYKKIAERYVVSISTVQTHICHIYHKLHVNSRAEAVAKVLKGRGRGD